MLPAATADIAHHLLRLPAWDAWLAQAREERLALAGLALTGTPLENRLLELWSVVDLIVPGYLGVSPHQRRLSERRKRAVR